MSPNIEKISTAHHTSSFPIIPNNPAGLSLIYHTALHDMDSLSQYKRHFCTEKRNIVLSKLETYVWLQEIPSKYWIEFFTIRISVRLSNRSKVIQNKINFVKNCSQWGLNSQPPDHQCWEESVGDFWSELSFVSCTTSHVGLCLFLESIEHDFTTALMIHTHNQIMT